MWDQVWTEDSDSPKRGDERCSTTQLETYDIDKLKISSKSAKVFGWDV